VDVHRMLKSIKMEKDRILKLPLVDTSETGCASSADQRVGMIKCDVHL